VAQLQRLAKIHPVAAIQPPYSMLRRDIENDLLAYCGQNGIGVVCYSPMQKGLLTGKFSKERMASLAADDHRRRDPNFQGEKLEQNLKMVEALCRIAERHGKTVAQLAIAWTLRRPEVTSAIVGARKPEQIRQTLPAGDWALSDEDISEIKEILNQ
jgi:aryl-alcohol dehydrogenase-like predicted oxidoreductase